MNGIYRYLVLLYLILVLVNRCGKVRTATIAPPPLVQTLDSKNTGPLYSTADQEASKIEDAQYWHRIAKMQLKKNIENAKSSNNMEYQRKAKNVIIFIGDGMGLTTITAGRIYKGQYLKRNHGEEETLAFDNFPYTGLAKTYNVDKQVPDSAGTATAIFSGSKTDYGAIGVDATRSKTNGTQGRLESIMDWAQSENKRTGIVTTTRITHATPAATYARIYHRDWECDTKVPTESKDQFIDIARQLVEQAPGNKFNVILGGGLQLLGATNVNEIRSTNFEGSTEEACSRGDNRNLVNEWLAQAGDDKNGSRIFVQTQKDLLNVDTKQTEHLLGLFRNNHITYAIAREDGEPSLKEMTETAIGILERGKNSKGYVLLVEGGRIDQGHHQNYARAALHEVFEFDAAIEAALNLTDAMDTLILVTADHSHAMTLNGYPKRGADILGFGGVNDPVTYETLSYANGPGYYDHLANQTLSTSSNSTSKMWLPLDSFTATERASPIYRHMATQPRKDETHGGEDVIVFAHGPGASLVRGVFEQNYLAYVMSYAGCIGPAKNIDDTCKSTHLSSTAYPIASFPLVVVILLASILSLTNHS